MDYNFKWRPDDDLDDRLRTIGLARGDGVLYWHVAGVLSYSIRGPREPREPRAWVVQVFSKETLQLVVPTFNERKAIENMARARYGL